jgi:hypothetical protein
MGIDTIQDQSQEIIAEGRNEFGTIKSRFEGYEEEDIQMKIKHVWLSLTYNALTKRMTDPEAFVKQGLPNYTDLQVITEWVNEIGDQTTGLIEAVAGAMSSATTPDRTGRMNTYSNCNKELRMETGAFPH